MSLLASASLILTPNGYKSGKLYSIVPSNGNGDLTFTRATSASRVNSSGLIENVLTGVPRLDYSGSTPSILLEPQRTNLALNSVWAGGGSVPTSWTKPLTTITTTPVTSSKNPNVIAYNFSGSSGRGHFIQPQPFTIGTTSSISIYVESVNVPTAISHILQVVNASGSLAFYKNNIALSSATNIEAGNTYSILFTATGSSAGSEVRFGLGSAGTATGDVTISMPQVESGSYATSYIQTTTSTVTRNADLASVSGVSSLIGQTEGVMFIESAALFNDLIRDRVIAISDGTANNRILLMYNFTSNMISAAVVSNGINVIPSINYTVTDVTQFAKIAVRYSNTLGASLWINGVNRASSSVTTLPISMNRFSFSTPTGDNIPLHAKVKSAQLYKTYLTDAEMVSLTTL